MIMKKLFILLFAAAAFSIFAATPAMRNVLDYGAVRDGKTLDTAAIQKAIDAGGIVHFPAGTYLTGTLYLKSGGGLDLAPGAVLLASTNPEDYNKNDFCPQNRPDSPHANDPKRRARDWVSGKHLIVAVEQQDIVIRGGGTICGNRDAFGPIAVKDPWERIKTPMPWRPGEMVWICECDRVTMQDVRLIDAPFWTCVLQQCNDVTVNNIRVDMNKWTRNGDGFTIDGCRNVVMTNCIINSADDSIVLKADHRRTKRKQALENVTITNCVLSSVCYAVRVGVGNGIMRNIRVDNIFCKARIAVNIGLNWGLVKEIENITFSNFNIDCELGVTIHKSDNRLKRHEKDVFIRNIAFENFRGLCVRAAQLESNVPVSNITVDGLNVKLRKFNHELCPYRDMPKWDTPFYAKNINGLKLNNINIEWDDYIDTYTKTLTIDRCQKVSINNCDFGGRSYWGMPSSFPKPTEEQIKYRKLWEHLY